MVRLRQPETWIYVYLSMPAHKYLPNYTVEDYNRWEGDWELINGIPYSLQPSPVSRHQQLGIELLIQIAKSIETQKDLFQNYYVVHTLDWIVNDNTVVRPDISLNQEMDGDFITQAPILIIEILSPSSGLKDRHLKFELYQEQGVKYYIVADPNSKTYQIYVLNGGRYEEQKNLTLFTIHDTCAIQLIMEEALAKLPYLE
jgi:Uma2 family endonuclease